MVYRYKESELKKKIEKEMQEFTKESKKQISNFLIQAFAFTTALSWNSLVQESFKNFLTSVGVSNVPFLSVILVTSLSIIAIYLIVRFIKPKEDK